jgi:hypothetical protein
LRRGRQTQTPVEAVIAVERDPLRIASLDAGVGRGKIGVTFAPGKNDRVAWARDLAQDLDVIVDWGAKAVSRSLSIASWLSSPSSGWAPRFSSGPWNGCTFRSAT